MFNALLNEINILLPGGVHLGLSKQQELQFCTAARRSKNKSPLEVSFHVLSVTLLHSRVSQHQQQLENE